MQRYNGERKCKKSHELPKCSRCNAALPDLTAIHACNNLHYICNICLKFLSKTEKYMVCPKCKSSLEFDYNNRKFQLYNDRPSHHNDRSLTACEKCQGCEYDDSTSKTDQYFLKVEDQVPTCSYSKKSIIRKSKSDEITNPRNHLQNKKGENQIVNSKLKFELREELSEDEEEIINCHSESLNPLMFNYNTSRRYVVPARPVICPITMCKRNVAATGFISHFKFEHREVSVIEVDSGEQYTLIVNPDQVSDDIIGCICLFTLTSADKPNYSSPCTDINRCNKDSSKSMYVPFTMMIARLFVAITSCDDRGDGEKKFLQRTDSSDIAFLVIWVCGFDSKPEVYYSLEATYNNYRTRACIYSGPVISFGENNDPKELFKRGECLIVSSGLSSALCEDTGSLDINVTFH